METFQFKASAFVDADWNMSCPNLCVCTDSKELGLSTVTVGTKSWRALASLPQVGMKEKGKRASFYALGAKPVETVSSCQ